MTAKIVLAVLVVIAILVEVATSYSALIFAGLALLFGAERLFADDPTWAGFFGGGAAMILLSLALRARRWVQATGTRKDAEQRALGFAGLAAGSLLVYGLTTEAATAAFGFEGEFLRRWEVVLGATWPILLIVGLLPMVWIDRALAAHPVVLPAAAARRAMAAGLQAALGVALIFPVNYIASQKEWSWDVSYFKVTAPGESTLRLVSTLDEPIEVDLFYPPGNDVAAELRAYFEPLEAASGGKLTVNLVDQALDPKKAEALKVRENGHVLFTRGEQSERVRIQTEMSKAKRELKKLDETVQKNLLKLARGPRNAYLLVGHGEASPKVQDDPRRKLGVFKTALEQQGFKVKNLGAMEGSTTGVPDDADLVIVASPTKALMPEEITVLSAYLDQGGRLLVLADPDTDKLPELTAKVGLRVGGVPVASAVMAKIQELRPDPHILATNSFGTHAVTSTLSKKSSEAYIYGYGFSALEELADVPTKRQVLVRANEKSWLDTNRDRQKTAEEASGGFPLVIAATAPVTQADGAPGEWRAIVVGNTSVFADFFLDRSVANQILLLDALRWLAGDEEIVGATENEEDVRIEHTSDENEAWFYGTIFGMPLLVLAFGALFTTLRKRSR